jgi:hypothetical protein
MKGGIAKPTTIARASRNILFAEQARADMILISQAA